MRTRLIYSIVAVLSLTISPIALTSNAAPNPIEIIFITEVSSTSVEILFDSNISKKSLSYYVINAAIDIPVIEQQNSKTQNVDAIAPKNIKKVIKTKATGLITAEIKNLNPKAIYNFSVSAKTNKGKMISSAPVEYSPLSNLIDALSNLPADWGNPKPIQLPAPAPTTPPIAIPAFTLSSATETRTVNTAATGFTVSSTGGAIASFAINATPAGMSFNATTGALTGTPNNVAGATAYTITATNASGSATQTFTLTVTAVVAPAFTLSSASESKTVNTAITGYTISSTGGTIASYAISPAAPAGLTFNTTTGLLSGTPTTVAGATAYTITGSNASGSATQTFTLTVTVGAALKVAVTQASVGSSPGIAFTTQPQITIQDLGGNTITSSTAVVTATVSTGGTLVGTATATASSGVATFSNLGIRGYGDTAYTITYTAAGLTTATQSVTPSALIVGNTGPGGGKIFYVATSTGFNCGPIITEKCYYLEAAPSGWNTGNDPILSWATDTPVMPGVPTQNRLTTVPAPGARETAIGTGYQNSDAIVAQTGNVVASSAAVAARAYRGNGLTDWLLPSKDELNQMCKWQRGISGVALTTLTTVCGGGTINTGIGAAGFVEAFYWSSSESIADQAHMQVFDNSGFQSSAGGKNNTYRVRPVRAF